MRIREAAVAVLALAAAGPAAAADQLRFWNLTSVTLKEVRLAAVGSNAWGPNQCENDRDKTVDHDERLKLTGVGPGRYDVRVTDVKGRSCVVGNVELVADRPYAFSLSDPDLAGCR